MGIISNSTGSPGTVTGANGGKTYGYNNISNAAPIIVAQANTARQSITFHNPGSVDIFIGPQFVQGVLGTAPTTPTNISFTPTTALLGGTFRVFSNGGALTLSGECQGAWQALAASGTTNPLTVVESNV
jgi:hypothetical protein